MTAKSSRYTRIFRNRDGDFRAGWRMVFYVFVSAVTLAPIFLILKLLFAIISVPTGDTGVASTINIIFVFSLNIGFLLGAWLTLKWIDRRPATLLGMNFWQTSPREFLIGAGIGLTNFAIVYLILLVIGQISIESVNPGAWGTSLFLKNLLTIIAFATFEELINRGYLFQAFCEGAGDITAVMVISVIFSLVHLVNPDISIMGGIHLFIHGLLYSIVYLKTRSLWTAIGLHLTWNFVQGPVAGMNVSGVAFKSSFLTTGVNGSPLLTGSDFGIEGSILTLFVSALLVLVVLKAKWLKPSARFISIEKEWKRSRAEMKI